MIATCFRFGFLLLLSLLALSSTVIPSSASQEFTDLYCLADIQAKDLCNVSFYSSFMSIRFIRSARSIRIKYSDILEWMYADASLKKVDFDLSGQVGIIGLLFKKVEHNYIFSINYLDEFSDRHNLSLSFDDKQYVLPMISILPDTKRIQLEK